MAKARAERRTDFFVRALAVVVVATVVHLALAFLLVAELSPPGGLNTPTELVPVAVLVGGVLALALAYVRTQYATASHVGPSVGAVVRYAPPVAIVLSAPVIMPAELVTGPWPELLAAIAPVLCGTWAAGFIVSIPTKRGLDALARHTPDAAGTDKRGDRVPPTVADAYLRIMAAAAVAASLIVIGAWLPRSVAVGQQWTVVSLAPAIGLVAITVLSAIAGTSLGQNPSRDIATVTTSLRKLATQMRPTQATPITVTRFDEVGELMTNLERLRVRLLDDLELYEDALDRTREADAIKSDFLSAVSHELRTPLNSVGGFAQLLLEGNGGELSEAQAEDVRLIRAGGHQLLELINDILDISMIESGELRLSFSSSDLSEVIHELVDIHRPLVRDANVTLSHEIGPNVPNVVCDRRRIVQILTNLVSNAVKFTEEGSIVVRAAHDPAADNVVIRVIDTGVGIAADELEAVFEEYRQAGPVKRRKKGTGLGLSIARTIAEHHGGSLTVESTPGEGSTFTLTLPRVPPTRPAAIDMAARTGRAKAARTMTQGSLDPGASR